MSKIKFAVAIIMGLGIVYSSSTAAQNAEPINYDELAELDVEVATAIGESDDFIFGLLKDFVLVSDETFMISDLRRNTIEQFNTDGSHLATVAGEGEGPGELPHYFRLFDTGFESFAVWDEMARRLDVFRQDSGSSYNYLSSTIQEQFTTLQMDLIGPRNKKEYYAVMGLQDAELIVEDQPDYRWNPVAIVDSTLEIVQDSLHILKTANYVFADPGQFATRITMAGLAYLGIPPYRYEDRFLLMENGRYMIARPDSAALYLYNRDHILERTIELNVKARSVQRSDLNHAFRNHETASGNPRIRRELESRVHDDKPPFLDIWVSQNRIWLHTDTSTAGNKFVVFTMGGEPLGRFILPEADQIQHARDSRLYVFHKSTTGHSIRIYQVTV